jgi:uroporphyrin-III C-methyltransferase / precorrin-2 dehydrogenase / sirohydrochlorin ferrochelatase
MTSHAAKLNAFPLFMRVEGGIVAIIGGGEEALAKARLLGQSSARLRIVSPEPEAELLAWVADNGAEHVRAEYAPAQLENAVLIFAATGDEHLDRRISADARSLGIPVNAVDRPELCDFFTPALVNRAPLAVAIGTEGAGPVLAQIVREKIDRLLPPSLGALSLLAAGLRGAVEKRVSRGNQRRRFWRDGAGHGGR